MSLRDFLRSSDNGEFLKHNGVRYLSRDFPKKQLKLWENRVRRNGCAIVVSETRNGRVYCDIVESFDLEQFKAAPKSVNITELRAKL